MSTPDEPTPPPDEARTRVLEQPPPPPRPPSRSLPGGPWPWLVGVLLLVVAGVLLAVFLTRGGGNASASGVSVPGLIGFPRGQAVLQAHRAGLKTAVREVQAGQAAGTVVSQNPAAGEQAPQGSVLVLTVSSGPAPQTVPSLIGLSGERAVTLLSAAGIRWKVTYVPSSQPYGIVVAQSPQAGTKVTNGLTVIFKVSRGQATTTTSTTTTVTTNGTTTTTTTTPAPVSGTVPNVIGKTLSEAVTTLENAGYIPRPKLVKSSKTPGTVISESPAAGTKAGAGTSVVIKIAGIS
jgi:beta-lactam-binding protein with PASTA domain